MLVCQVELWFSIEGTCDKKGGHSYFGHIGNMPPDGWIMRSRVDGLRRLEFAPWSALICPVDPSVKLCHIPNQPGNSRYWWCRRYMLSHTSAPKIALFSPPLVSSPDVGGN